MTDKRENKFKEGNLFQVELACGDNLVLKSEGGRFHAPAWCRVHKRLEWLKVVEPLNMDEVITILEMGETIEEYEKYFIEKNRERKMGIINDR